MTQETIFSIANSLALAGWIILAVFPRANWANSTVAARIIPLTLAAMYIAILILHGKEGRGSFNTLAGVVQLFENPWGVLAGWIHYLAFDLFIGAWETRDAMERGIHRLLLLPCLILTFLLGPVGLAVYFVVRFIHRSRRPR